MLVTNTTNTIELSQDGNLIDTTIKKSNIDAVTAEPYISQLNNWQSADIQYPNRRNLKVKLRMSNHTEHTIDLTLVSNQSTWFNSTWTTDAQFQGGLVQATKDIQSWL